jgi:hypothetical protein
LHRSTGKHTEAYGGYLGMDHNKKFVNKRKVVLFNMAKDMKAAYFIWIRT